MFRFLIIFFLLFTITAALAEEKVQIKDVRYYAISNGIRTVIETSGVIEFTKGQLKNPERLFFDFKNATIGSEIKKEFFVNISSLNKIRIGRFDTNTVRVVFDLTDSNYQFKIIQLEDPYRVVIDIYPTQYELGSFKEEQQEIDILDSKNIVKRKIVIDAGHGGHDPGAIGPNGLREKDVVLDIALKVRELMKKKPHYEIILTRDSDIFIPLDKRAEIANKAEADLFISIHANATPNNHAKGIETYILNWTDDEQAIRVAARENAISVKKQKQLKGELGIVLASLEREAKRDKSVHIAGYLHNSIVSNLKTNYLRHDNGLKQALFYVLVGAKMPSCLLEISYISNPEEEALLSDESYRLSIAKAIVDGIENYFSKSNKVKQVKYTDNFLNRADSKKNKSSKSNRL